MSLFQYQNALKYAIKMSNLVGQSIAIGNIGKIGTKGLYDNTDKMKVNNVFIIGFRGKVFENSLRATR